MDGRSTGQFHEKAPSPIKLCSQFDYVWNAGDRSDSDDLEEPPYHDVVMSLSNKKVKDVEQIFVGTFSPEKYHEMISTQEGVLETPLRSSAGHIVPMMNPENSKSDEFAATAGLFLLVAIHVVIAYCALA
jgi:hypothetical protein